MLKKTFSRYFEGQGWTETLKNVTIVWNSQSNQKGVHTMVVQLFIISSIFKLFSKSMSKRSAPAQLGKRWVLASPPQGVVRGR